jgi:RHS repeat-associated protein
MIETRDDLVDDGTEKQLVRYQMHNFIGSAVLELDSSARVISYEEFHPFGTTAFQAKNSSVRSAAKRYRFAGRERDEESGLYYFKARYFACWLGRWLNCDPAGMVDGSNLYVYTRNNPVRFTDAEGMQVKDLSENAGSRPSGIPDISSGGILRDIIFKPDETIITTPFGQIKDPVKEPPPDWLPQKGEEPWKKQEPVKSKGLLNTLLDRLKPKEPQPPTLLDTFNDAKQQEQKGRMPLPEPKGTFVKDIPTELTDPLFKKTGEGVVVAGGALRRFQKKAGPVIGRALWKAFSFIGKIFRIGFEIVKDILTAVKGLIQNLIGLIVDAVRFAIVSIINKVQKNKNKTEPEKEDIKKNLVKAQQKVERYSDQMY